MRVILGGGVSPLPLRSKMNWSDVFDYRDGELYWKIKPKWDIDIGTKAGYPSSGYTYITFKGKD